MEATTKEITKNKICSAKEMKNMKEKLKDEEDQFKSAPVYVYQEFQEERIFTIGESHASFQ